MLMMHYLDKDFKPEYLELPQKVDSEEYYVKMMIACFMPRFGKSVGCDDSVY